MIYIEKVSNIIANEKDYLDSVANEWIKGNVEFANKKMYLLFNKYGYKSDTKETNQLLDYVISLISLFSKQGVEVWKQIPSQNKYECTIDGDIRRVDNKQVINTKNDRVELTIEGKRKKLLVSDLVYETFYSEDKEESNENEAFTFSSDLDYIPNVEFNDFYEKKEITKEKEEMVRSFFNDNKDYFEAYNINGKPKRIDVWGNPRIYGFMKCNGLNILEINEIYEKMVKESIADDLNFTGNIIRSATTETSL